MPVSGASPDFSVGKNMVPYNDGGTYQYYCYSDAATAITDAKWWVTRVTVADGTTLHAQPPGFNHAATDLSTVAALTYA